MKLRKVKYNLNKDGFFHQWGVAVAENYGNTELTYTVAIIEDAKDGKVYRVHPEDVKFEDRPPLEDYMSRGEALKHAMDNFSKQQKPE